MTGRRKTDTAPWRWLIPGLLIVCVVLLGFGVTMPIMLTDQLGSDPRTYSIIDGISKLIAQGKPLIAVLVLIFSVVFPPAKLMLMTWLWFWRLDRDMQHSALWALHFLGKWSMLDVFVVAVVATAADLGILSTFTARGGAMVFAAAIAMSMLLSYLIMWRLRALPPIRRSHPLPRRLLPALLLEWLLVIGAMTFPLMEFEKWVFWKNSYSILEGIMALMKTEAPKLGFVVFVFVIVLPIISLLGWTSIWVWSRVRTLPGGLRYLLIMDEWAMVDVFGLAVAVVLMQTADSFDIHLRPGVFFLGGWAVIFSFTTTWIWRLLRVDD